MATTPETKKIVRRPYPLPSHIGFLLHDVSRLRRTVFDKVLRPLGITRAQWWLLVNLSHLEGKGTSQRELASRMQVGKVTVGAMLALLDANGYVTRHDDDTDGRVRLIFLTDEGYAVLEQTRQIAKFVNGAILSGATAEQIAVAEDLLRLMKKNLVALDRETEAKA